MTNFAPVEPETATGQAAELLARVQRSLGRPPTMTKAMANSPALLQGYLALSGAVAGGTLKPAVRERLAIALNILTNYVNILAHVDNDWPVVSL